jgi:predicted negative regulator of RcsB-dependent stress response
VTTSLAPPSTVSTAGRQDGGARVWKWIASAALAIGLVVLGDLYHSPDRDPASERPWQLPRPVLGPATYAEALNAANEEIERRKALVATFPDDWVRHEGLALALIDRFRLTGDYVDLAQARGAVERGMQLAEAPGGPVLAFAEIGLASHHLGEVEAALALLDRWVAPHRSESAAAAALAGDVAFYRGDMAGARDHYARAQASDAPGVSLRMAVIDMARGNFDAAIHGIRTALEDQKRPSPYAVATTALRIGAVELARGNAAEARRRFEEADRVFPGYWLVEAHVAQAAAIDGDRQRGIDLMREVAERSGSAEAMDALAMFLRAGGQPDEGRAWARRAAEAWNRRIELAPEAAYGHAVEHELVFGTPARALALARRNLASRPFGESRVLLASALVQNGRNAAALDQLERAEMSGWVSAPLHALRAEILALEGDSSGAAEARAAAMALNPRIFDREAALVWFSHG